MKEDEARLSKTSQMRKDEVRKGKIWKDEAR